MSKQKVKNNDRLMSYVFDSLKKIDKIKTKRDFSKEYLGRAGGYFTMISTGIDRHSSLGAIQHLKNTLTIKISEETDRQRKFTLEECLIRTQMVLENRLNDEALKDM